MTQDYSDYSPDYDRRRSPVHDAQPGDWGGLSDSEAYASRTLGAMPIGVGMAIIATALVMVGYGWRCLARSTRLIVPSAADIHVRMPPPR